MKIFVLLFVAVFIIGINGQRSRFENFDIDSVLKNDRILTNYVKCILDQGPCTREGKDLKRDLPETLEKSCSDCSAKLRSQMKKLINILETKKQTQWKQIQARYDPTGELTKKFKEQNP